MTMSDSNDNYFDKCTSGGKRVAACTEKSVVSLCWSVSAYVCNPLVIVTASHFAVFDSFKHLMTSRGEGVLDLMSCLC